MRMTSRLRPMISTAALALFALFFVPGEAAAAKKVPSLASTPQYKAFSQFVTKLERLQGSGATAAQKQSFELELTAKHAAAVNRSAALFNRAKQGAKVETQAAFKLGATQVRREEAAELAALRSEYADRLVKAAANYSTDRARLEDQYDARTKRLHQQIATLRMRKANATGLDRKTQIQAQINVIVQQVQDSDKQEEKGLRKLEERYREQRAAIQQAKANATGDAREDRQESIESLTNKRNRAYNGKVAGFRTKRQNQLADLEAKLGAGRLAISLMPTTG